MSPCHQAPARRMDKQAVSKFVTLLVINVVCALVVAERERGGRGGRAEGKKER